MDNEGFTLRQSSMTAPGFVDYPDSPFHLYQPYPPAGDQPGAIEALSEGIRDGLMCQTLLGVTGSGKTYTMANIIAQLGRPALVLAPNKTLAAQLYAEMREFFPKNAVEYFVSYYDYYQPEAYVPTRDLFIEKDSSINEHIEQMRLSATKSLLERRDTIIVGTVSCIYGIGNPGDYHAMVLILRSGDRISRREILARLVAMQYTRNDADFTRRTFRVRGETIDTLPTVRCERAPVLACSGGDLDSIELDAPVTGPVRLVAPRAAVAPGAHSVTPRGTVLCATATITAALRARHEVLPSEGQLVGAQ